MMNRPNSKTKFKELSEIDKYSDPKKYFCVGVVFSPDTENDHYSGCPPYIEICKVEGCTESIYFRVPEIVAYYAKTHPQYTMRGLERRVEAGKRLMTEEFKRLLNIKE